MSQEKIQGGAMGGVEELYREVILDHFKAPKNRGPLENANTRADGMNPLCGDTIAISGIVENGVLKDVHYEGHGCAISQSAASMLTELMKGKSLEDVKALARVYKGMFGIEEKGATEPPKFHTDDLGDLISLEGVRKYPVRIKCAVLSANTLLQSIEEFFNKKGT